MKDFKEIAKNYVSEIEERELNDIPLITGETFIYKVICTGFIDGAKKVKEDLMVFLRDQDLDSYDCIDKIIEYLNNI
ncbi:MAG: hypothetical protein HUJ68_09800 [Clostridia bacterium]|nr:hypothetical protein [Clostridia bacterium]